MYRAARPPSMKHGFRAAESAIILLIHRGPLNEFPRDHARSCSRERWRSELSDDEYAAGRVNRRTGIPIGGVKDGTATIVIDRCDRLFDDPVKRSGTRAAKEVYRVHLMIFPFCPAV